MWTSCAGAAPPTHSPRGRSAWKPLVCSRAAFKHTRLWIERDPRGCLERAGRSQVLHDGEDVAFAVLEPSGLRAAGGDDAVHGLVPGRLVFLEGHAARLGLGGLALDVRDLPEGLARLRGPGVGRGIQKARGAPGKLVDDAAPDFLPRLEAELPLVELARA